MVQNYKNSNFFENLSNLFIEPQMSNINRFTNKILFILLHLNFSGPIEFRKQYCKNFKKKKILLVLGLNNSR